MTGKEGYQPESEGTNGGEGKAPMDEPKQTGEGSGPIGPFRRLKSGGRVYIFIGIAIGAVVLLYFALK